MPERDVCVLTPTNGNGAVLGALQELPCVWLTANCLRLYTELLATVDCRISISREPFASGAMEHSSPSSKLFETRQLDPKSSLSIAWLRIAVLAPGMCRLLGSALVAWSQQTSSRPDASWTPCPGPVATYLPRAINFRQTNNKTPSSI